MTCIRLLVRCSYEATRPWAGLRPQRRCRSVMSKSNRNWALLFGASALMLVALLVVGVTDPSRVGLVRDVLALATALGTLAAGIAAWRAAQESNETARQAREALSLGLRPALQVDVQVFDGVAHGRIMPAGPLPARDLSVLWRMRDGQAIHAVFADLEGWRPDLPPGTENSRSVALPPLVKYENVFDTVESVSVEFEDSRGVGRWSQKFIVVHQPPTYHNYFAPETPKLIR